MSLQVSKGQKVTAQHENEQSLLLDQLNRRKNSNGYNSVGQEYFEEINSPAFKIKLVDFADSNPTDLTSQYVYFNTQNNKDQLVNYNQQFIPFCQISQIPSNSGAKAEINFGNEIYSFAKSLSGSLTLSSPESVNASIIFISAEADAEGTYYYTLANDDEIAAANAEIVQKFKIANLTKDEYKNDVIQQVHTGIITYSTEVGSVIPDTQYSKQNNLGKYGQYSIENKLISSVLSDGLSVENFVQQLHQFNNNKTFSKNAKDDDYFYGLSAKDVLIRLNRKNACTSSDGQMLTYLPLSDMQAAGDSQLSDLNLSSIYVCQDPVCQDVVKIFCFENAFKNDITAIGDRCTCVNVNCEIVPIVAYNCTVGRIQQNVAYVPFTSYGIVNDVKGIQTEDFVLPKNLTTFSHITIGNSDESSTIKFRNPTQPISVVNKLNNILYLDNNNEVKFADLSVSAMISADLSDIVNLSAGDYITINENKINGASIEVNKVNYSTCNDILQYSYSKDSNKHKFDIQPSFQDINGVKATHNNRSIKFDTCPGITITNYCGNSLIYSLNLATETPCAVEIKYDCYCIFVNFKGAISGGGGDIGCYVRTLNCLTGDVSIRGEGVSVITNTWNNGITISAPAPHCGYSKIGSFELSNTYGNLLVKDNFGDTCTNDFVPLTLHAYKCTYTKTDIIELSTVGVKQTIINVDDLCKSAFCYNICNYSMLEGHYLSSSNLCIDIDYVQKPNSNGIGCLTTMINIPDKFPSSWVLLGEDSSSYPVIMQELDDYQIKFKYNKISSDIFTERGQTNVLIKENTGGPIQLYVDKMPNTLYTQQYVKTEYTATCPATISSTGFGWQLGARGMLGAACTLHDSVYWSGTDLVVDYGPLKHQIETCIGSSTVVTEEIEHQISVILSNILSNYVDKTYLSANAWLQNCYQTNKAEPSGIRIGSTQLSESQLRCLLNLI